MITHEIKADLVRKGCSDIIHLTQGDTNAHQIRFKITKNRRRWKLPAGLQVLVHYSNAYGSGGTYDTLADGSPAWTIEELDLCVTLVPEIMALPGSVHVVITLLCGEAALSAFHVRLMVEGLACAAAPVLANYSNITGFLPRPETAEKGQFFAAETVTETGKVLTVTATDAPDSSSSLPTATVTETKDGALITVSDKNGTTTAPIFHGRDGKSAYDYARDGGYPGTAAEFAEKLAEEFPDALKNPHALTINGKLYDGSEPVEVTVSGNQGSSGEATLSDNLFDKSAAVHGKGWHHSSSGPYLFDSDEVYYSYAELRGAGTYRTKVTVNDLSESYAVRVPLMKSDKTWLQNITGTITDTGNRTAWDLEFIVTQEMIAAGACYYAITVHKDNINTMMMVKDRDYPAEYIPYGYVNIGNAPIDPDWNAGEGQPGHILNRTHYAEWVAIFPEAEVPLTDDVYALTITDNLKAGESYNLVINQTEYPCTAFDMGDNVLCLGNPAWIEVGEDNGLPFIFVQEVPGAPLYGFDDQCAELVTFTLYALVYHPLDIRYLPEMQTSVTVHSGEETSQSSSLKTYSLTMDATQLVAALHRDVPIFIIYRGSNGMMRRIPADVTAYNMEEFIKIGMLAQMPMTLHGNSFDIGFLVHINTIE